MHFESVVWVAELKDIIHGLFYILALCFYVKYIKNKDKRRLILYILAIISFTLSCFSKSAAVTLPVVLIVFDYYLGRKFSLFQILEKIPFFIIH